MALGVNEFAQTRQTSLLLVHTLAVSFVRMYQCACISMYHLGIIHDDRNPLFDEERAGEVIQWILLGVLLILSIWTARRAKTIRVVGFWLMAGYLFVFCTMDDDFCHAGLWVVHLL